MNNQMPDILQTKKLAIGFSKGKTVNTVLSEINIFLKPGELVCFMGPNGVGKSTLLRTISGVQKPLKGEVLIKNVPIGRLSLNEKAKLISIVLTERSITANLSVHELIALGRHPYTNWTGEISTEDQIKIDEAMSLTKIEALAKKKLHTLSDGQLQKVMIARALAQDSDIMILDEPTAHLDLNNRLEVMNLLLSLAHLTNKAILIATHELDLAVQTADRLWLAAFEKPIQSGTPEDMILNGAVEKTFFNENIKFDLYSGRFLMPQKTGKKIWLQGDNPEKLWTRYALERIGYQIEEEIKNKSNLLSIEIKVEDAVRDWVLKSSSQESTFHSIEALLNALTSIKK